MRVVDPGDVGAILVVIVENDQHGLGLRMALDDLHHLVGAGRILYQVQDAGLSLKVEVLVSSPRLDRMVQNTSNLCRIQ